MSCDLWKRPSYHGDRRASEVHALVADHRAMKVVGVGALDLHGGDLADAQRPAAREMNGAVDLRRVAFAAALGDP